MLPPLIPSSISSSQTPPESTSVSSYVTAVDGSMGASIMVNNEYYEVASNSFQGNSGLLDALVMEGHSLSRNNKPRSEDSSHKRKTMVLDENSKEGGTSSVALEPSLKKKKKKNIGDNSNENLMEKKEIAKEPMFDMEETVWDDYFFSLLTNFPIETMPDWYSKEHQSESPNLQNPSPAPTTDQDFGWNSMLSIC